MKADHGWSGFAQKDFATDRWIAYLPNGDAQFCDTRQEAYDYLHAWRLMNGYPVRRKK